MYGSRPKILITNKNDIKDAKITAHLCAPIFRGVRSCRVNWHINQFCSVEARLSNQRADGVGRRTQGRVNARAIRGMPINAGLINWSKRFSAMVNFKGLVLRLWGLARELVGYLWRGL